MEYKRIIKRHAAFLALIAISLCLVFDRARFQFGFIAIAQSALIAVSALWIVGSGKEWGIFPVSLEQVIETALTDPKNAYGAVRVLYCLMAFISLFIVSVFVALYGLTQ